MCVLNFSSTDSRTVNVRAYRYPVFYNLAPRPIKYRVSVPIPSAATVVLIWIIWFRKYMLPSSLRNAGGREHNYWDKNEQMSTVISCFEVVCCRNLYFLLLPYWAESSPECYDWCETVKKCNFLFCVMPRRKGNRKMIFQKVVGNYIQSKMFETFIMPQINIYESLYMQYQTKYQSILVIEYSTENSIE